jgi:hypothetical protein
MTREIELLIAALNCRSEKGGCGRPIAIVFDPPRNARPLTNQRRMQAIHSDEINGRPIPSQIGGTALVYKLRGALEDRCASQRENFI